ncbi:MAG: hypothetical protein KatS3mg111_1086 [Pirellulaceae bacterium]|nr:MAG: hypothetical protein KatS3mg111_1086 [Pirellulaceae bacterium]
MGNVIVKVDSGNVFWKDFVLGQRMRARSVPRRHAWRVLLAVIGAGLLGVGLSVGGAVEGEAFAAEPKPRLGMNLSGPADWNTELPFVDVFRLSRRWISQQEGQPWGKGPELDLDEHGWVKSLQPGCFAETLMCTIEGGHYPSGRYVVLYEGNGELQVRGAGKVVQQTPGRIEADVDSSKGALFLQLRQTDPADYVRNIRVIMPGFEDSFESLPFHPIFLDRWRGVACLRFMDWMETNNSPIKHWSDRPTPRTATFTEKGVPLEWMIDLCNHQQVDPWFCMPHMADDEYIRNFARMVRERLDPRLTVYVEYSNEVWNGTFQQNRWAAQEGMRLGFSDKPWEAAWRYTAYRSLQIFAIWEDVFGGRERLVRVLASQAANPAVSEQVLQFQDAYRHADALAVAPYISFNVPASGDGITAATVENWTLEQLMDHVETHSLPQAISWIRKQKAIADKFGVRLIAYEGGQHLVGVRGGENSEKMTDLFHQANRHQRMGLLYDRYYQAWEESGGELFCYFSSVSRWSKWGSWGILEYFDDDPARAPKFMSTMRWAKRWGQPVHLP